MRSRTGDRCGGHAGMRVCNLPAYPRVREGRLCLSAYLRLNRDSCRTHSPAPSSRQFALQSR